jgi:hypothetical protein
MPAAEGVGAVSWGPHRLDVFAAGQPGNQLYHWWWDGSNWSAPEARGGNLKAESVSAVSWGANRLDVFAVEAGSGQLLHWCWDGSNWNGPEPHGGTMNPQGVSAVSWGANRLDVFAVEAGTGQLLHWSWDGANWGGPEPRGGKMNSETVSAVCWGPNRIDVFGVEAGSGQLLHWAWDGSNWGGPQGLGGTMNVEGVSAVSSGPNRLSVFGIEAWTGQLLNWSWDGSRWINAVPVAPDAKLPAGDVSAVCRSSGQIDVLARAADNSLGHWPDGLAGATATPILPPEELCEMDVTARVRLAVTGTEGELIQPLLDFSRTGARLSISAAAFYLARHPAPPSVTPPPWSFLKLPWAPDERLATVLADLTVTGGAAFANFRSAPPTEATLVAETTLLLQGAGLNPAQPDVTDAANAALDRAFLVAWALRGPHPVRAVLRESLGWIAVVGENDPPRRPVNVSSAPYPQFEIPVTVPRRAPNSGSITVQTRFFIASPADSTLPTPGPITSPRTLPPDLDPQIPADHRVILFIPGHSSSAEEALDIVPWLHKAGLTFGTRFSVVAVDLPCNGYSSMFDHTDIAPSAQTTFPRGIFDHDLINAPILDFIEDFIVAFVDALDSRTPVKNCFAGVIGGSLGGNMGLRLGRRSPLEAWLQKGIVSWSAASVWAPLVHDEVKSIGPVHCRDKWDEVEATFSRPNYFKEVFGAQLFDSAGKELTALEFAAGGKTQPSFWYRPQWEPCKTLDILEARLARIEIYNMFFRRWHWRVAGEQLIYSHVDRVNREDPNSPFRYQLNRARELLMAGSEDNYQGSNIYDATRIVAQLMGSTPGRSLFLLDTGHSMHIERPRFVAGEIAKFFTLEVMQLQLAAVADDGKAWHAIRSADGGWTPFGDVMAAASNPGPFTATAMASVLCEVHLTGVTGDGKIWHAIRRTDGSWTPFGDVTGQAGNPGNLTAVAVAGVAGELQLTGTTDDGKIWHTIRHADGSWTPFGDVTGQAGNPGSLTAVAVAGAAGELQLAGITGDGKIWHTIRHADGSWTPFGDVTGQAGNPGSFKTLAMAGIIDELQLAGITTDGKIWHTIRHADGSWTPFGDVTGVAGSPGTFKDVATAGVAGELQLAGITVDGNISHTIRDSDGGWTSFADVMTAVGGTRRNFTRIGIAST